MILTGSDGDHSGQTCRRIRRNTRWPANDRAVALERQCVITAGGDCHHTVQAGGLIRQRIVAPVNNRTVTLQGNIVDLTRADGDNSTQTRRQRC